MKLGNLLYNGKSQTGSSRILGSGMFHPVKLAEQLFLFFLRDHIAVIDHAGDHQRPAFFHFHPDQFPVFSIFYRIIQKIFKHPGQEISVRRNRHGFFPAGKFSHESVPFKGRGVFIQQLCHQLDHIQTSHVYRHLPVLQLHKAEQFVGHLLQMSGLPVSNIEIFFSGLLIQFFLFPHPSQITDNGGQRGPQIMGDAGNQVIFCMLCQPLTLHNHLDIGFHLIQIAGDLAKFIQCTHRNLFIKISLRDIPDPVGDNADIFHISADQSIETDHENHQAQKQHQSPSDTGIQAVRSHHGASVAAVTQPFGDFPDSETQQALKKSGNSGADQNIKCHPLFKGSDKFICQFYIPPPRRL